MPTFQSQWEDESSKNALSSSHLNILFKESNIFNFDQGNPKRPLLFIPGGVENQHPEKVDALGGAQGLPPKTTSKARPTSLGRRKKWLLL